MKEQLGTPQYAAPEIFEEKHIGNTVWKSNKIDEISVTGNIEYVDICIR